MEEILHKTPDFLEEENLAVPGSYLLKSHDGLLAGKTEAEVITSSSLA